MVKLVALSLYISDATFHIPEGPLFSCAIFFSLFFLFGTDCVESWPSSSRTGYVIPGAFFFNAYRVLLPLLLLWVLLYVNAVVAEGAAASCCCSSSRAGWQKLLLVRWIWFQRSLPLHSNTILIYPLAVYYQNTAVAFWCLDLTCEYILGNYGHARNLGGRQPAAAKPPF